MTVCKAVKFTFTNSGSVNGYIYTIDLWGEPVKVVDTINVEEFDQDSIDDFEERVYNLKTSYIQDLSNAVSKAAIMVDDYKDYGSIVELDVKGNPALQIGDAIDLDLDGYQGTYTISKKVDIISGAKYTQKLRAKQKEIRSYFILSSDTVAMSVLDGADVLTP